jgi:hypothetical protein
MMDAARLAAAGTFSLLLLEPQPCLLLPLASSLTFCLRFSRASRSACAAAIRPMALSVPVCGRGRVREART